MKRPRGSNPKSSSILVAVWIPTCTVAQLDTAVQQLDTDRSKVIRRALREHLSRIQQPTAASA